MFFLSFFHTVQLSVPLVTIANVMVSAILILVDSTTSKDKICHVQSFIFFSVPPMQCMLNGPWHELPPGANHALSVIRLLVH
jgi:hypothetical protein